jgi:hypothetical protein
LAEVSCEQGVVVEGHDVLPGVQLYWDIDSLVVIGKSVNDLNLWGNLSRGQALMTLWICSSDRRVGAVDISAIRRWDRIMV